VLESIHVFQFASGDCEARSMLWSHVKNLSISVVCEV